MANGQKPTTTGEEEKLYEEQKSSRPTVPCGGPRMNRQVDVGNPPRPFRHLRLAQRRTPDPSSSRAPVHSALVQISVTAITNAAGRLSRWMLGKSQRIGNRKAVNSWQMSCNQSNAGGTFQACILSSISKSDFGKADFYADFNSPFRPSSKTSSSAQASKCARF
jgi:hypothetical protein